MAVDDRWWGARARLQVAAWRGTTDTVVVTTVLDRPAPSPEQIRVELAALARTGISTALTGALHEGELGPFLDAGFTVHERLHLLRHELHHLPEVAPVRMRRAWRRDLAEVLAIDARAFDEFWTLDRGGLDDAIRATPTARYRVAVDGNVAGYAVTGRAGPRGYLQRLAVDPDRHRHGIGTALVVDGLRWLARTGARVAMVNTQEHNQAAMSLYLATGFIPEPHGLTVLRCDLLGTAR